MRCAPRARAVAAPRRARTPSIPPSIKSNVYGTQVFDSETKRAAPSSQVGSKSRSIGRRRGMATWDGNSIVVGRSVAVSAPARPSVQPGNEPARQPASACEPGAAMRQPGRMRRTADGGRRGDQRASEHKPCRGEPTCPGQDMSVCTCSPNTPHQPTDLPRRSGDFALLVPTRARLASPNVFR